MSFKQFVSRDRIVGPLCWDVQHDGVGVFQQALEINEFVGLNFCENFSAELISNDTQGMVYVNFIHSLFEHTQNTQYMVIYDSGWLLF